VQQPWAGLIAHGRKDVENRSWVPDLAIGERFAIHAGRLDDASTPACDLDLCQYHGVILCTVVLLEVSRDAESNWALPGYWHWRLGGVRLVRPLLQRRGHPRLWELDA
jgi:hypothetical protein